MKALNVVDISDSLPGQRKGVLIRAWYPPKHTNHSTQFKQAALSFPVRIYQAFGKYRLHK